MLKTVTFGVIAYNEHGYLPDLLDDLMHQSYPHEFIEVILVDGESTDDTWDIMKSFSIQHIGEFLKIRLYKNPKRIQPAGWNIVLQNSTSDILLRIDAHARIPKDFVEKNVDCINRGEYVCGGPRENIIDEDTAWKRTLLMAEQSMFGAGVASYRKSTNEAKYVKSLFHAAYRKEVIDRVGMFNESLIRTEDNEYHYRVNKSGYKIYYNPEIQSCYQTRNSLKGMLKQKWLNGFWIGKTLFICPACISLFHLVPVAFVFAIVISTILAICGLSWPTVCLWFLYGILTVAMTVVAIISNKEKNICMVILPVVFFLLHISYGVGTIAGIINGVFK